MAGQDTWLIMRISHWMETKNGEDSLAQVTDLNGVYRIWSQKWRRIVGKFIWITCPIYWEIEFFFQFRLRYLVIKYHFNQMIQVQFARVFQVQNATLYEHLREFRVKRQSDDECETTTSSPPTTNGPQGQLVFLFVVCNMLPAITENLESLEILKVVTPIFFLFKFILSAKIL